MFTRPFALHAYVEYALQGFLRPRRLSASGWPTLVSRILQGANEVL
jgi:hypothetical protein